MRSARCPAALLAVPLSVLLAVLLAGLLAGGCASGPGTAVPGASGPGTAVPGAVPLASVADVAGLAVRGRGPRSGYSRAAFGPAWSDVDRNGCDTRNDILRRDLTDEELRPGTRGCVVLAGRLAEPYSGRVVLFSKSRAGEVQIDHVVALSDAWQKGAARWPAARRLAFANDPLNLLAVDGRLNQAKGDGDAATWLPPNQAFRCAYVSRQAAVKRRWQLSVTPAERDAMVRVLTRCVRTERADRRQGSPPSPAR